jgi:molecular chaperone DnaJ
MVDAIVGTKHTFEGLDGEISVEIKPGTQSADVLTVKNRGITKLRGHGRGDLRVGIHVVTPTKLSAKEKELIAAFAAEHKVTIPELVPVQQGIFAKLRGRFF